MQYRKMGSAKDVQIVSNEQATISGLTPSTEYIISVAAVNSADTGPYSDEVVHKTAGEHAGADPGYCNGGDQDNIYSPSK